MYNKTFLAYYYTLNENNIARNNNKYFNNIIYIINLIKFQ